MKKSWIIIAMITILVLAIVVLWSSADNLFMLAFWVIFGTPVAIGLLVFLSQRWDEKMHEEPDEMKIRRSKNHCVNCDYDLRGNISGRCPECGSTIEWHIHGDV